MDTVQVHDGNISREGDRSDTDKRPCCIIHHCIYPEKRLRVFLTML